jgi:hypothetical protein
MSNGNQSNPGLDQLVSFTQHDLPGLADGQYQLQVTQKVTDTGGKIISDDSLVQTYSFAVLGDRFRLKNPPAIVYSVFPPDNGSGEFTTVLPHVVFLKSTFPWSRYPNNKDPATGMKPGSDTDVDVPTWLTIILLDDSDVAANPGLSLAPQNATIGDLFPLAVNDKSTLDSNYSYFWEAKKIDLDPADQLTDAIQVLDLPLPFFWQIAPTLTDLELSAHVREVSLLNKPTIPGVSDVGEPNGSFSIVFGNRLPSTAKKTRAYLVSLEQLEDFLPTSEDGGPPSGATLDAAKFLRLAVLQSWTFYSTGETATFVDGLLALNGNPAKDTEAEFTNLVLPYYGTNPVVKSALSMGYTPLSHNVRTAEKTVSWYRGPLVPYSITEPRITLPIASPDQATIFDPTTGMLDTSYSAAWTLGRLMALQDQSFSTGLYNWKKGLAQSVVEQIENGIFSEVFREVLAASAEGPHSLAAAPQTTHAGRLQRHTILALQGKLQS